MCGLDERTTVVDYNKFLITSQAPDEAAKRYDYSVCHGCGILYATRRPSRERLRQLLSTFSESLGRPPQGAITLTNPYT